ncbi:DUF664 domain-containing protein [Kribbella sp. NPDC023972]|uniref:mycothiol transferase n=1 Tax=Kribbella sp. NPDC023972 TaxID=3154795 RepID=UPI0033D0E068
MFRQLIWREQPQGDGAGACVEEVQDACGDGRGISGDGEFVDPRILDPPIKMEIWAQLRGHRSMMLAKLDGLSEYDRRRPLTPTGTNLLGLVKHLAGEEYGYLGDAFGRHAYERPSWFRDDPSTEIDMCPRHVRTSEGHLLARAAPARGPAQSQVPGVETPAPGTA